MRKTICILFVLIFFISFLYCQDGTNSGREDQFTFMKENAVYLGDSQKVLQSREDNSVDAVVTDPPYGLKFMGKKWDYTVPSTDLWKEVYRVLKPGGHVVSFGGSRTYHRLVLHIEQAGFEIRDQLIWIYASGFPKSLDVEKALKKKEGAIDTGRWSGWGTGLKPAHEPIVLARKPISEKTVTDNIIKWGTGGINIDKCRLATRAESRLNIRKDKDVTRFLSTLGDHYYDGSKGRYPSNFIIDESALELLCSMFEKDISRYFYVVKPTKKEKGAYNNHPTVKPVRLMEYLVSLITPAGGVVLDPFAGSGTTGVACGNLQYKWILVDRDRDSVSIALQRIRDNILRQA